ncbi:MAG: lipo-like protein, partial [Pseudomonadales bacterium]|nr:lipo-like protein [Pseudomonadales bacterium]
LEKYSRLNVRICRPINLNEKDRMRVVEFVLQRLGNHYDLKNVFDLMRYLLPTPPVPERFRRKLIAFGSGDPTRAICSTLIAQAFQSIRYPIMPRCAPESSQTTGDDIMTCSLETIHYSHFVPRDFDLSPYFEVVKFLSQQEFDYTRLVWVDTFENR